MTVQNGRGKSADPSRPRLRRTLYYVFLALIGMVVLVIIGAVLAGILDGSPSISRLILSSAPFVCGVFAVLIGGAAGAIELMGRYRDAPFAAIRAFGAQVYIGINALVSCVTYILFLVYDNSLLDSDVNYEEFLKIAALAGFGSLAIMRTSIAKTEINGKPIEVGPALVIDTLLKVADRAVDRHRATDRLDTVPDCVRELDDDVPIYVLQSLCMKAMQNLDDKEVKDAEASITALSQLVPTDTPPGLLKIMAGLLLQQIVGIDVLRQACAVAKDMKLPSAKEADLLAFWDNVPPVEEDTAAQPAVSPAPPTAEPTPDNPTTSPDDNTSSYQPT